MLHNQSDELPGCSLETFEMHHLLNKVHVFVKLAGPNSSTARWVFAKVAPEKMKFEEGKTIRIGMKEVEERSVELRNFENCPIFQKKTPEVI